MGNVDCLGRIPYASVIGFIMVFVGAGIMCGTLYEAVDRTDKFFTDKFFQWNEFIYVRISGIVASGTVVILALIILIFAILATGATYGKVYRGDRCILGGRCSAGFFMFLAYIANAVWLCISAILVVPVLLWLVYWKICYEELTHANANPGTAFTYNFNLTHYGLYIKPDMHDSRLNYRESISNIEDFKELCRQVTTVGPLYACSLGGAFFVILGLVAFIGALASIYMRIKFTRELTSLRQAHGANQTELDYMLGPKM